MCYAWGKGCGVDKRQRVRSGATILFERPRGGGDPEEMKILWTPAYAGAQLRHRRNADDVTAVAVNGKGGYY